MSIDSNKLPLPKRVDIEPTIRCNFHCPICQRTYWDRKKNDMSLSQFKHAVQQFPNMKQLKIQGMGEPLLNEFFFDMINYAKSLNIEEVSTYTNGSFLNQNDNAKRLIDSGINLVRVSVDSGTKSNFEKTRPGSNFLEVIDNIGKFNSLALRYQHPTVEIWTVITNENVNQLMKIIDLAKQLDIYTVHFQTIMNTFDYKDRIRGKLLGYKVNTEELFLQIDVVIQYADDMEINLIIEESKAHSKSQLCHWPFDSTYITVDGFVVPCCTIADPTIINMGNIFEESFEKIWVNKRYQKFRESIITNNIPIPCKNCYRL